MEEEKYDVYCDFDPVKHKKKYINYCEVMILESGKVVYAVPSHQMKAEQLACEKLGLTREQLSETCPEEAKFDWLNWLLSQTGAIAVWTDGYVGKPNDRQKVVLKRLKLYGIYSGPIA